MRGKMFVVSGPSGVGKGTIVAELIKQSPELHLSISATTRKMRVGEKEGVNYYYYTPEQFLVHTLNDGMLEYTQFNGWFYGTSKDSVREDKINIGVFNPEGIRNLLRRNDVELIVVRVWRPAKLRLLGQLNREENPNVSEIIRRAAADEKDFAYLPFEYTVIENEIYDDLAMGPANIIALLDDFN